MDKRQQLIQIIKKAQLPEKAEELLLAEVAKQAEITDDFIMDVADTLDRIGLYLQSVGEVQADYFDTVIAQAQKVNGAYQVLQSIEDQLNEKNVAPGSQSEIARDDLRVFTASAKPTS